MKLPAILFFLLSATPVAADPGHIAEVAGHSHWIAAVAAAAAAAVAVAVAVRRGKDAEAEPEGDADAAEEAAQ